jgi:Zn-dependent peptidase ImmA (M78 family)
VDKPTIEKEARRVQFEVWSRRELLWPMGQPRPEAMFDPRVVAEVLDLHYDVREHIASERGAAGEFEAAGSLNRQTGTLAVSGRFDYAVQRFTAAHEIGHFVLHPWVGDRVAHRDRPIHGYQLSGRPAVEQEADYFAACLLIPVKPLVSAFEIRFGTRKPLPLNETVAFHLAGGSAHHLFTAPRTSLQFATAVAKAESFDGKRFASLARTFEVSTSAMAIRLREVGLVVD